MLAVTIWQPWASLIAAGAKPYEWRGWPAPKSVWGQRIAIHAGRRPAKRSEIAELLAGILRNPAFTSLQEPAYTLLERWHTSPGALPLSSVLCTAVLGTPIPAKAYAEKTGLSPIDSDRIDHTKWGWPLSDIRPIEPFVPASGKQGFWHWEASRAA